MFLAYVLCINFMHTQARTDGWVDARGDRGQGCCSLSSVKVLPGREGERERGRESDRE